MMRYDLLLKGGRVLDIAQGINDDVDLAVVDGRIAELAAEISADSCKRAIDVSGKIITPGLIDLHAHLYWASGTLGIDADRYCPPNGVTTVVDAGSAGAFTVEGFRAFVASRSRTRILAFLSIAATGLLTADIPWECYPEFTNVERAVRAIDENRDFLVGVKVRATEWGREQSSLEATRLARQAAERAGVPMMVHMGATLPLSEVLAEMRSGDILTHVLSGLTELAWEGDELIVHYEPLGTGKTILDAGGHVLSEVWDARRRGVLLDVGHGLNSFSFEVARGALSEGLLPDVISTDLHAFNVEGPRLGCEMLTVMSKCLALGMTLPQVVERCTVRPAQVIGKAGELGTLQVGAPADIAVLALQDGKFEFRDSVGQRVCGFQNLTAIHTLRDGRVIWSQEDITADL